MIAAMSKQGGEMFQPATISGELNSRVTQPAIRSYSWSVVRLCMAAMLVWMVSGCAVFWVSAYDKQSVDRTTEISENVLALYQQLISTEQGKRVAAVGGPLNAKCGEIETQIRVHLLLEQARAKNTDSTAIVTNLLESWQKFSAHHRSSDATALTNATLNVERGILERHLRSAFLAEESKKLGGGAAK